MDLTDANPHDIAALLKEFFRSLPEPLMTRELFGPILGTRSEFWWRRREGEERGERRRGDCPTVCVAQIFVSKQCIVSSPIVSLHVYSLRE